MTQRNIITVFTIVGNHSGPDPSSSSYSVYILPHHREYQDFLVNAFWYLARLDIYSKHHKHKEYITSFFLEK